tara:strand:- start:21 stop:734 length:714 start_codon:yes stop_codon:yes gene_type:complete
MFDYTVQIFKDDVLKDANLQQYIDGKKVVISPALKIDQKPTLEYLEYLDGLLDTHMLDEVILIKSSEDKFFHHTVQSYLPRLTTVTDKSQHYLLELVEVKNKKEDFDVLQQKWTFQQIINDSEEIGFWEQPMTDTWKHLMSNKKAIKRLLQAGGYRRKIVQKFYKNRNNVDPWTIQDLTALAGSQAARSGEVVNPEGFYLGSSMFGMGANFFYFNLYHNKELETTLQAINNRSGKTQ